MVERDEDSLLGMDAPAKLSNNVQSGSESSIYCNFYLNCLSGSMDRYKCFH